jgi:hypothetical protein
VAGRQGVDARLMRVVTPDDPTAESEGLWVRPGPNPHEYVVDNIPMFARGISRGDTVHAVEAHGELLFQRVTRRGDRVTYQLLIRPGVDERRVDPIIDQIRSLDAAFEGVKDRLLSLDVDRSREPQLIEVLEAGWQDGVIWYEAFGEAT